MATVLLFWNTNMAAVRSCENALWVILKEGEEIETNVKKFVKKLNWLMNHFEALIFDIPAILLLFLETIAHFEMLYLLKHLSFSNFRICFYSYFKITFLLRHQLK